MRRDRPLQWFILSLWLAFILRGTIHSLIAPMWDGFDEPFHLAYVTFVAQHGRPPGFTEASFPDLILTANRFLPSFLGYGAPSFSEWSSMTDDQRSRNRAELDRLTGGELLGSGIRYTGPNYERQQGPLYYYLGAPVALLCSSCNLAELLIALRLFSVLLASLVVPLSAILVLRTLGRGGLLVALPIVALAPNTLFFVDRVTNDALAWPLMAAICILLVEVTRPFSQLRHFVALGLAITAGICTKLTLLPALPAAIVAVWISRRTGEPDSSSAKRAASSSGLPTSLIVWCVAVGFPVLMTVILVSWNKLSSGTFTGLAQSTAAMQSTPAQWLSAARHALTANYFQRLTMNHLWSGGWAFVQPSPQWYVAAAVTMAALIGVARIARPKFPGDSRSNGAGTRSLLPLIAFGCFFVAAMLFHVLSGTVAARQVTGFPAIGAEGWYLDLLRPLEAMLVAVIVARRGNPARWLSPVLIALLVAVDGIATVSLLLPHWAGAGAGATSNNLLHQALISAPLKMSSLLLVAISVLFVLSVLVAARSGRHVPSPPLPAGEGAASSGG